jgi:ribulokinase
VAAVHEAMSESGVSPEEISGISHDCTSCTVVALDESDQVLRPAILWMDVRAADQARRIGETGDPALKYNGFGPVSAEWMPSKALWLKENEPDTYSDARRICEYTDWMTHRLTGEWTASINNTSIRWYYDRDEGGWPESLYEAVGLDDLLEKFPQDVLDLGTVVGGLRKEAAEELGLRPDIPVAQGGVDAYVAMVGLDALDPGKMALITGSSHVMLGQATEPIHGPGFWGAFTDAVIPGQYVVEGGQVSTGSVVAWFKNRFAGNEAEEAERRGVDTYDVLNELARDVPPGSEGLVVIDYWQGNRTPHTDPEARGMMWGLSLSHDTGHVFRAILEGICYGTEHIFRTLRENEFEPREIVAAGGPTKSDLWMQMHADVSGLPISFTKVGDAPALGSAILASVGAEIYPDIKEAASNMVHTESSIEPDQERHEEYKFYVDKYVETYPRMQELMHDVVRHVAG